MSVSGQKKYSFDYRIHLKSQPSTYKISKTPKPLQNNSLLIFVINDQQRREIFHSDIHLKSLKIDSFINFFPDEKLEIKCLPDTFCISVSEPLYTILYINKIITKPNFITTIKIALGRTNELFVGHIHSIRKLTDAEVNKIIDNLSNDQENILIKNKTCVMSWEI